MYRRITSLVLAATAVVAVATPAGATGRARATARWTFTKPTRLIGSYGPSQREVGVGPAGKRAIVLGKDGLRELDITRDPARVIGHNSALFGSQLAVDPRGHYAYVGNGTSLYVADISSVRPTKVRSYNRTFTGDIGDMVVSGDGKWLYVAFGGLGDVSPGVRVYSLAHPSKPKAERQLEISDDLDTIAVNRAGTRLAVGLGLSASIQFIDTSRPAHAKLIGHKIALPNHNAPTSAVFGRDGRWLYVVGRDYSYLTRIDADHRSVSRNVSYTSKTAGDGATSIGMSAGGHDLYVAFNGNADDDTVFVINRTTMRPIAGGTGLLYPTGLAVSHDGPTAGRAYVVTAAYGMPGYFIGVREVG